MDLHITSDDSDATWMAISNTRPDTITDRAQMDAWIAANAPWQAYDPDPEDWLLEDLDGSQTVYVWVKDNAPGGGDVPDGNYNLTPALANIFLDREAPDSSFLVSDQATGSTLFTNGQIVDLALDWEDTWKPVYYRVANSSAFLAGSPYVALGDALDHLDTTHTLADTVDGDKTVYVQFRDGYEDPPGFPGHETEVKTQVITFDGTAPEITEPDHPAVVILDPDNNVVSPSGNTTSLTVTLKIEVPVSEEWYPIEVAYSDAKIDDFNAVPVSSRRIFDFADVVNEGGRYYIYYTGAVLVENTVSTAEKERVFVRVRDGGKNTTDKDNLNYEAETQYDVYAPINLAIVIKAIDDEAGDPEPSRVNTSLVRLFPEAVDENPWPFVQVQFSNNDGLGYGIYDEATETFKPGEWMNLTSPVVWKLAELADDEREAVRTVSMLARDGGHNTTAVAESDDITLDDVPPLVPMFVLGNEDGEIDRIKETTFFIHMNPPPSDEWPGDVKFQVKLDNQPDLFDAEWDLPTGSWLTWQTVAPKLQFPIELVESQTIIEYTVYANVKDQGDNRVIVSDSIVYDNSAPRCPFTIGLPTAVTEGDKDKWAVSDPGVSLYVTLNNFEEKPADEPYMYLVTDVQIPDGPDPTDARWTSPVWDDPTAWTDPNFPVIDNPTFEVSHTLPTPPEALAYKTVYLWCKDHLNNVYEMERSVWLDNQAPAQPDTPTPVKAYVNYDTPNWNWVAPADDSDGLEILLDPETGDKGTLGLRPNSTYHFQYRPVAGTWDDDSVDIFLSPTEFFHGGVHDTANPPNTLNPLPQGYYLTRVSAYDYADNKSLWSVDSSTITVDLTYPVIDENRFESAVTYSNGSEIFVKDEWVKSYQDAHDDFPADALGRPYKMMHLLYDFGTPIDPEADSSNWVDYVQGDNPDDNMDLSELGEGPHRMYLWVMDRAENITGPDEYQFTIDRSVPQVVDSINAPFEPVLVDKTTGDPMYMTTDVDIDYLTNDPLPKVVWGAVDDPAPAPSGMRDSGAYELRWGPLGTDLSDEGAANIEVVGEVVDPISGMPYFVFDSDMAGLEEEKVYVMQVWAFDNLGQYITTSEVTFKVDRKVPVADFWIDRDDTYPPSAPWVNGKEYTRDEVALLTLESDQPWKYSVGRASASPVLVDQAQATSPQIITWNLFASSPTQNAMVDVVMTFTDEATNTTPEITKQIMYDRNKPAAPTNVSVKDATLEEGRLVRATDLPTIQWDAALDNTDPTQPVESGVPIAGVDPVEIFAYKVFASRTGGDPWTEVATTQNTEFTYTESIQKGTWFFKVVTYDRARNVSNDSIAYEIDILIVDPPMVLFNQPSYDKGVNSDGDAGLRLTIHTNGNVDAARYCIYDPDSDKHLGLDGVFYAGGCEMDATGSIISGIWAKYDHATEPDWNGLFGVEVPLPAGEVQRLRGRANFQDFTSQYGLAAGYTVLDRNRTAAVASEVAETGDAGNQAFSWGTDWSDYEANARLNDQSGSLYALNATIADSGYCFYPYADGTNLVNGLDTETADALVKTCVSETSARSIVAADAPVETVNWASKTNLTPAWFTGSRFGVFFNQSDQMGEDWKLTLMSLKDSNEVAIYEGAVKKIEFTGLESLMRHYHKEVSGDFADDVALLVESQEPMLVSFMSEDPNPEQVFALAPAHTSLVGSTLREGGMVCFEDGTDYTVSYQLADGSEEIVTGSCDRGDSYDFVRSVGPLLPAGVAITATKPVAAHGSTSKNHQDAEALKPAYMARSRFVIPQETQTLYLASLESDATCSVYDASNAYVETISLATGASEAMAFATVTVRAEEQAAGGRLDCSAPVMVNIEDVSGLGYFTLYGGADSLNTVAAAVDNHGAAVARANGFSDDFVIDDVNGNELRNYDFNAADGNWDLNAGKLVYEDDATSVILAKGDLTSPVRVEGSLYRGAASIQTGIVAMHNGAYDATAQYYMLSLGSDNRAYLTQSTTDTAQALASGPCLGDTGEATVPDSATHLALVVDGNRFRAYCNGRPSFDIYHPGNVALLTSGRAGAMFVKGGSTEESSVEWLAGYPLVRGDAPLDAGDPDDTAFSLVAANLGDVLGPNLPDSFTSPSGHEEDVWLNVSTLELDWTDSVDVQTDWSAAIVAFDEAGNDNDGIVNGNFETAEADASDARGWVEDTDCTDGVCFQRASAPDDSSLNGFVWKAVSKGGNGNADVVLEQNVDRMASAAEQDFLLRFDYLCETEGQYRVVFRGGDELTADGWIPAGSSYVKKSMNDFTCDAGEFGRFAAVVHTSATPGAYSLIVEDQSTSAADQTIYLDNVSVHRVHNYSKLAGVQKYLVACNEQAVYGESMDETNDSVTESTHTCTLADGDSHYFHLRPVDNQGNISSQVIDATDTVVDGWVTKGPYKIDTVKPDKPLNFKTDPEPVTARELLNDSTPLWTWDHAADDRSGRKEYRVIWTNDVNEWPDEDEIAECTIVEDQGCFIVDKDSNSWESTVELANGEWWAKVRVYDEAGNWTDSSEPENVGDDPVYVHRTIDVEACPAPIVTFIGGTPQPVVRTRSDSYVFTSGKDISIQIDSACFDKDRIWVTDMSGTVGRFTCPSGCDSNCAGAECNAGSCQVGCDPTFDPTTDPESTWEDWETYEFVEGSAMHAVTLDPGSNELPGVDGTRTVCVGLIDDALNESTVICKLITLDTQVPTHTAEISITNESTGRVADDTPEVTWTPPSSDSTSGLREVDAGNGVDLRLRVAVVERRRRSRHPGTQCLFGDREPRGSG